jgi:microcystin degradation protein MlrC
MPRILFAGLFHETHTFLDGSTTLADFQIMRGDAMLATLGDSSPLGGVLELAQGHGWEVIPTVDYRAQPSAIVEDEVLEAFWGDVESAAQPALTIGIDAVFLVLHGAMVTRSCRYLAFLICTPTSPRRWRAVQTVWSATAKIRTLMLVSLAS